MAAVPPAIAFALMPAQAGGAGLIDYTTREGVTVYRTNTRCLYTDTTQLFNCKPEGLNGFLTHVDNRIREANWPEIFDVPIDNAQPLANTRPFLTHHGMFDLEHLRAFAGVYIGNQGRAEQDNFQAVTAIMESLSEDAISKVTPWKEQYTVADQVSAVCLLKVIIRESNVDSNATCRIARSNLRSLDSQLKVQGYDIEKLNAYVQTQMLTLRARGEQTLDLFSNLLDGYGAAKDQEFLAFINRYKQDYDQALNTDGFTAESLMVKAAGKYRQLVTEGKYNVPSKEQVKLLALESQIKELTTKKGPKAANNSNQGTGGDTRTPRAPRPA
jgi:hypothetical protein